MIVFLSLSILSILFGARAVDIGTDTEMYSWQYQNNYLWADESDEREPLYPFFIKTLRLISNEPQFFLFVMSFMFNFFIGNFILNFQSKEKINKVLFFLSILATPVFLGLGINIIRQGVAMVLLLNAYNAYNEKKYKILFLFAFFSVFFHTPSILPLMIFFISRYVKNIKFTVLIYILGIFLAFLNFGLLDFFGLFSFIYAYDPRFDAYSAGSGWDYVTGFKTQFVVFNTVYFLVGIYIYRIYKEETYFLVLNYFAITSFVFFMAFQLPFSDRWGVFSWISLPILISPLLNLEFKKNSQDLSYLFFVIIFLFFNVYQNSK